MSAIGTQTTLAWSAPALAERSQDPSVPDATWLERYCALGFLSRATESMARTIAVPAPELAVESEQSVNAMLVVFESGRTLLVLSSGLLDRLRPNEACAVIAHELAHLANKDPGFPAALSMHHSWRRRLTALCRGGLWAIRNRRREHMADALAAELVGVDALIGALAKSGTSTLQGWLDTHPSPAARIRRLERNRAKTIRRPWNQAGFRALPG